MDFIETLKKYINNQFDTYEHKIRTNEYEKGYYDGRIDAMTKLSQFISKTIADENTIINVSYKDIWNHLRDNIQSAMVDENGEPIICEVALFAQLVLYDMKQMETWLDESNNRGK